MKLKYYDWHTSLVGYYDIVENFTGAALVVDAGCGTGWVGECLKAASPGVEIVGLDLDTVGLKRVAAEWPVQCDASRIPLRDRVADGIVALDILEHTGNPLAVMVEFHRILKAGGQLYISVPDARSSSVWDDYTHVRPFTRRSLVHLADDAGFSTEKLWYSGTYPGAGALMKALGINRTPWIFKALAAAGINRRSIIAVCRKESSETESPGTAPRTPRSAAADRN